MSQPLGAELYSPDVFRFENNSWKSTDQLPCRGNFSVSETEGGCYEVINTGNATGQEEGFVPYGEIWTPAVIQRVATLSVIMLITVFGNVFILIVLSCSKYRKRHSRVNIFIINLAIGDLAVCCFTMTSEILFVAFGEWVLGAAACKIITYFQIVTLASTTFILTAMSFDRFMAICKPLRFATTISRARKMIAVAWVLAFLFAIPQLFIFIQTKTGIHPDGKVQYKCLSKGYTAWWQRKLYFTWLAIYILAIPAVLISYCYINVVLVVWGQGKEVSITSDNSVPLRRSISDKRAIPRAKIKTIKMTLAIILSFIACWTPYFVTTLIIIYSEYTYKIPESVIVFAETAALLQSALNPLWYGFFNIKLKRGLMEVFCPQRLALMTKYNSRGATMSECMSMTEDYTCVQTAKRLSARCREQSSSSSGSYEGRSRTQNSIIEENKNGYRLRVRFTAKDTVSVGLNRSQEGLDNGGENVTSI